MSINSRGKTDTSPERTKVWSEPKSGHHKHRILEKKVAVIYYLSQNGLLEHPHFIEVALSSPQGLYLRDVISRLNQLRGVGMASMYAWSSKRTYKSGYVWQDLSENDFIYPCHGHDYILKGSRLLESSLSFRSSDTASSETNSSGDLEHHRFSDILIRRSNNRSLSLDHDDLNLDKITYRAKTMGPDPGAKNANSDATAQTEEKGRKSEISVSTPPCSNNSSRELGREGHEIGNARNPYGPADIRNQVVESERPSGRIKASAVLMQLIMCGSKDAEDIVVSPHTRVDNRERKVTSTATT